MGKTLYQQYMDMTGDSFNYLLSGEFAFGPEFIDDLVKEALEKKKRIVWIDESKERGKDAMSYRLDDLD